MQNGWIRSGATVNRLAWLVIGVGLMLVANGRWIVPLATWLAPIGWLVFLERSRPAAGLPSALVLFVLVNFVVWRGLIPAPGILYYLIAATYALVYFLPFLIHTLLVPQMPSLGSTLIFPFAWVGIEFAFQRWITPYGSWFSLAYTQADHVSLLQLASLTGAAGISFLMTWFAASAAALLRPDQSTRSRKSIMLAYALAFLATLTFGQVRLARSESRAEPVRVAAIVPAPALVGELEAALAPVRRGARLAPAALDSVGVIAARLNEDLLERTRREARAGAQLVAWSETAGRVLKRDEPELVARAGRLAAEEGVDLILGYGVWDPAAWPPFENKVVAITSNGEAAWDYQKAHPIVGAESPFTRQGEGTIRVLETPYGRVGAVICHDLDFPALLRLAGRQGIGLMVGPSSDWREIAPLHAKMAIPRAIENGFSLLRPTSGGRSIATDPQGRVTAKLDYADDSMVAYVAAVPVGTLYGSVGELFAWLCLAAFVSISLLAVRGSWSSRPRA